MQPEGIISGDFSTESVFSQLCLQESELLSCNISDICVSGHCCKVSDEAAFCLIQRPYISKTLLTRRISPRGSP
ncbi:hypothetical protein GYC10_004375 [Salmonella enterica]|nr:hypothetical protein [Salmonella enterica]